MNAQFTPQSLDVLKKSYFNILAYFFKQEKIDTRFMRCLLKWGIQLGLDVTDFKKLGSLDKLAFQLPGDKFEKLEVIYHLVCIINMDRVTEDVELEVASAYAQQMGFSGNLVQDLLKSIATSVDDGASPRELKSEVLEFLRVYKL